MGVSKAGNLHATF